ncbi:MAG: ABC transporter substrate-binding protein [Ardenticatenaceae bacterium]|nr:ABC transporter substrate-binding protein [Ardenticatenaceae bacterium]MCB8949712.1 ABC transporter substrate-binding protein [Ardenticatenaceae bacterium]
MKKKNLALLWLTAVLLMLVACQPAADDVPAVDLPDETPVAGVEPPPGFADWDAVLQAAQGQTVNFYMWGGSDLINGWVTGYVADAVQERYGVTLNMVPVADGPEYVNKVLGEQQAGRDEDGSVDLVWVNGENYRTMRQAELLYGPFSEYLPNSVYVNWDDPSVANDFGLSVDGYEAPYGKAQFVMIYDSAKVENPPTTVAELLDWIEANPGLFTYPAPPDFTGSAFVRHICYDAVGGYENLLGEFDQALFDEQLPACWDVLNQIEPFLWREGETYPESHTRHQELFANGEVYFDMAYNPAEASSLVENGRYPETTRTFVFDEGTIANTHYVAIPYNSPHKAAAMVVANFLLSPEAQLSKAQPENWGDLPVLNPSLLSAEDQAAFDAIPRGVATLSTEELAANRLPELQAPWLTAIEQAWETAVLQP